MKKWVIIVVAIVVAVFILSVAKDLVIKVSVEKGVQFVTGLKLSMRTFRVGLVNSLLDIRRLTLFNPKGFKDRIMINMPEIYVDYDLPSVIKGKIHLTQMRINLEEFIVVKNEKGELNLDSLNIVKEQKEGKKKTAKAAKALQIQIDDLELKIGKVIYKDYSKGGEPSVKEFNVNSNEKYKNITDPTALASLIIVKALMNTSIASLANFDLGALKGVASDTLKTAQKMTAEAAAKTQEAVGKTTSALTEAIKLPFGSGKEK